MKNITDGNGLVTRFLIVSDFDQSVADTFTPSPNGLGVEEAYQKSIELIFGEIGIKYFKQVGGVKNRAPIGLIDEMLKCAKHTERESMEKKAARYLALHTHDLGCLVPANKGVPLSLNHSLSDPELVAVETIAELLVRTKLSLLYEEIGKPLKSSGTWPAPCTGFKEFCLTLARINKEGKINLELGIISAGHDLFIKRTFESWGLPPPGIMVTDDDTRGMRMEIKEKVKPAPFLFDLIHTLWLQKTKGDLDQPHLIGHAVHTRKSMIFFGDDPLKDGELADNSEVPFGWFRNGNGSHQTASNHYFSFDDWRVVAKLFWDSKEKLAKTGSLQNIFS